MSYNAPRMRPSPQHPQPQQTASRRPPPTSSAPRTYSPTPSSPLSPRTMPSPRSSPAMRPTSPLSPGFKQSAHFDTLQPPPQRPMHSRTSSNQQRRPNNSLKLPSLPRFHPANFPSAQSSVQSTPDGTSSPQPPVSPRAHQRMYSDAQKQLYFNQISAVARGGSSNQTGKPVSPRLQPLGSPGPVTPLELEGEEEYLLAGARSAGNNAAPQELVEQLIREETRRQRSMATAAGRPTSR